MVRRGMSPQGTLLVALARQSLGGIACKHLSIAGKNSAGSSNCLSRSLGRFLASFQMHFKTSSATFASCESGVVRLLGNGLTILSSSENNDLRVQGKSLILLTAGKTCRASPKNRNPLPRGKYFQKNEIDESGYLFDICIRALVSL
jgi:hypothetical protein